MTLVTLRASGWEAEKGAPSSRTEMYKEYVQNRIIIWLHEDQIDLETIWGMLQPLLCGPDQLLNPVN